MSLEKFRNMIKQAEIISKIEYSENENESEPQSLTGAAAHKVAMKMFPRRK